MKSSNCLWTDWSSPHRYSTCLPIKWNGATYTYQPTAYTSFAQSCWLLSENYRQLRASSNHWSTLEWCNIHNLESRTRTRRARTALAVLVNYQCYQSWQVSDSAPFYGWCIRDTILKNNILLGRNSEGVPLDTSCGCWHTHNRCRHFIHHLYFLGCVIHPLAWRMLLWHSSINQLFNTLAKYGLIIILDKCMLGVDGLDFLSHRVTAAGLKPLHAKCQPYNPSYSPRE